MVYRVRYDGLVKAQIPDVPTIKAELLKLGYAQMQQLAVASSVPFTTLWKVRSGETENPGIETVRKFLPHVASIVAGSKRAKVAS